MGRLLDERIPLEELLGGLEHHAGQGKDGDEVGDGHKAVESVGDVPGQAQVHRGTHQDHQGKDDLVGLDGLGAQDVLPAAGAVEAPAEDCGQSEEAQADGDDQRADL